MKRKTYTPSNLGAWREAAGSRQPDMAEAMGISRVHLSNVERGKRPYNQAILEAAVDYLRAWFPNLTPADILGVDPFDPEQAAISDIFRHIAPKQRETAIVMLRALSESGLAEYRRRPPGA